MQKWKNLFEFSSKFFIVRPSFILIQRFAQLTQGPQPVESDKFNNVKEFYENLTRFTKQNERGIKKYDKSHLTRMIHLCKDQNDIEITVNAYYNFLGHRVQFSQKMIDNLILKSIECNSGSKVHDIIKHHNYLMYYPHFSVLTKLVQYHAKNNETDHLYNLSQIIETRKLIKIEVQTVEQLIDYAYLKKDAQLSIACYRLLEKKQLTVNEESIQKLLLTLYYYKKTNNAPFLNKEYSLLGFLKTQKRTHRSIIHECLVFLADIQIDKALIKFSEYSMVDPKTVTETPILNNSDINKEFFKQLGDSLAAKKKKKYYERFLKVFDDIKQKLGKDQIHQEIILFAQQQEQLLKTLVEDPSEDKTLSPRQLRKNFKKPVKEDKKTKNAGTKSAKATSNATANKPIQAAAPDKAKTQEKKVDKEIKKPNENTETSKKQTDKKQQQEAQIQKQGDDPSKSQGSKISQNKEAKGPNK